MDNCLRLIVYRDNAIFDDVIVKPQRVLRHEQTSKDNGQKIDTFARNEEDTFNKRTTNTIRLCARGLVSYLVSAYFVTLSNSCVYRNSALRTLFGWLHNREYVQIIFIRLRTPKKQFLDYKW